MTRKQRLAPRVSLVPFVPVLLVVLCRCGGAQQSQAPTPTTPNAPGYGDVAPPATTAPAGAVHVSPAQPSLSPPAPPGPPPPPPPADRPAEERGAARIAARAEFDQARRDLDLAATDCESACRALASMERATSHLCSLAEEPDDQRRCDDAKLRLTAARGRVHAACGGCR